MYCDNDKILAENLCLWLNVYSTGAYLEDSLDQPLDLSIKRATDYPDIDTGSNSVCSSASSTDISCGNDDQADEEADRNEDLQLYNFLRENPKSIETPMKNRSTPVLWQFLLMCLSSELCNPSLIEWVCKENATFQLKNVNALASLWGQIKKRPRMNADHFKRSLRSYYARNILRRIEGYLDTYQFIM